MCLLLTLLALPIALCDVRFPDTSSNAIVLLIVFFASASVVLVPCMYAVYLLKRTIDKEHADLISADSTFQLPTVTHRDSSNQSYELVPEMKELVVFKNWFTLFERRVRSS